MRKWLWLVMVFLLAGCGAESAPLEAEPVVVADTVMTLPPETEPSTQPTTIPIETEPHLQPVEGYELTAHHAFVYDVQEGSLRFTLGDMDEKLYPASLTKLFTAWVALEWLDPKTLITCGEETAWIDPDSSRAWVTPGDTMTVERLIQGMMMQSGNDAAYAAAVAAGRAIGGETLSARKALGVFMEQVNRRAEELGLLGTHFVTPDGLHDYDHYTTANDLLQIALLVMEQPILRHYTGLAQVSVMYENGEFYTYRSTNYLLQPESEFYTSEACGMKTGTTKAAGSCLVALFHNGEHYILIGVLGCPQYEDRFRDARQLYALYGE